MNSTANDNTVKPPKLLLFDVYETMLDMREIEKLVNSLLNSKRGYTIWFELFMQYTFVDNCTEQFNNFQSIADATLRMASQVLRSNITSGEITEVIELMKHLPLKEGVQKGLSGLHDKKFRIAALTNSPETIVRDRMERTGLISYFEEVLSAERVKKYKPDSSVYKWACKVLDLAPAEIMLVSAHGWDIAGAENAGMQTAYIEQSHQMLYPLAPVPHFRCRNIPELCNKLSEA